MKLYKSTDQNLDTNTHQEALLILSNFLYFMEFIKSASPHTLRAYQVDLRQFFQIPNSLITGPYTPFLLSQKQKLQCLEKLIPVYLGPIFKNHWGYLSAPSRNRKTATLKSFFHWAFSEEIFSKDYSTHLTCAPIPQKIPHFLSVDEVLSILSSFKTNSPKPIPLPHQILFLLLYGGGLRISEACNLTWKDTDWEKPALRILGKGKKERLIPLPELCIKALREHFETQEFPKYLLTKNEKPLNPRTAYTWIENIGVQANLQSPLNPHALRHSLATHLLSSGMNLRVLQNLLGHASLRATEKYTHLDVHRLAEVMQKSLPLRLKLS